MLISPKLALALAAGALSLPTSPLAPREDQYYYAARAYDALATLQQHYYEADSGLYRDAGWWNSANCLTTLADFALVDPYGFEHLGVRDAMGNTFERAQEESAKVAVAKAHGDLSRNNTNAWEQKRGFGGFINWYYDDEGWWALALVRGHDLGLGPQYINKVNDIFHDMKNSISICGGGIVWQKGGNYTNAITNELYLSIAASLANRVPAANKQYYLDIAVRQWQWFKSTAMINRDNLINDGLGAACENNGLPTWTYNQGVILGGLVELSKATGDTALLDEAKKIAYAAMSHLSKGGILNESCEPNCQGDSQHFKGIFMRNLHYLHKASPDLKIRNFIVANADSILTTRNAQNEYNACWNGEPCQSAISARTHCAAVDVLVAARAIVGNGHVPSIIYPSVIS